MRPEATLAIVNPTSAGGRTEQRWKHLRDELQMRGVRAEEHLTTAQGEATTITRSAIAEGFSRILSVGGDGTLNEVVNGCFDATTGEPLDVNLTLGLIPSGSGGDFRRSAGLHTPEIAIDAIADGHRRPLDVGRIDYHADGEPHHRHFVNVADWGVGAAVVARVNSSEHKAGGARGSAIFLGITLSEVFGFTPRTVTLEFANGQRIRRDVSNVVVANGQYFGGGMRIAPTARLDDGLLDVITVPKYSAARTLWSIPRLYRGSHLTLEGVTVQRASRVTVHASDDQALAFEVEGEWLGEGTASVRCLPRALRMNMAHGAAGR